MEIGAPEGTRTPDLLLRRQLLYPVELLAQTDELFGAGDGNRTHTTSLEGWGSTTELHPHVEQRKLFYHINLQMSIPFPKFVIFFFALGQAVRTSEADRTACC